MFWVNDHNIEWKIWIFIKIVDHVWSKNSILVDFLDESDPSTTGQERKRCEYELYFMVQCLCKVSTWRNTNKTAVAVLCIYKYVQYYDDLVGLLRL